MKVKLQITLEGDDALAFLRARAEAVRYGIPPARVGHALLARAAEAYAQADDTRGRFWAFELRARTPEERAVFDLLHPLSSRVT
jgi:hypothetical protein